MAASRIKFINILAHGFLAILVLACLPGGAWRAPKEPELIRESSISRAQTLSQGLALERESVSDLAKSLGIESSEKALEQAKVLSERIRGGFVPSDWSQTCPKTGSAPAVCVAVDDYFEQFRLEAAARSRVRRERVNITLKNVNSLQDRPFITLLRSVPNVKKGYQSFKEASLKRSECPRNFSLALARELEDQLPDPQVLQSILALDTHGLECLGPDDDYSEYLHLRAALLRIYDGQTVEAIDPLRKAVMAKEKREEYRSLFWLHYVLSQSGDQQAAVKIESELSSRFPLSWFQIVLRTPTLRDPLSSIMSREPYPDRYDDVEHSTATMRIRWLKLLMHLDDAAFAQSRYGEWVLGRLPEALDPAVLQHLARIFEVRQLYKLQIIAGTLVNSRNSDRVTLETLRLLYPRPFYDAISSNTADLDTFLILGLARQESAFDVRARSTADARGLLQVLPSTARLVQRAPTEMLYDAAHNISVGSRYFKRMLDRFDNRVEYALAAYNAGPGRVDRWGPQFMSEKNPDVALQLWADLVPFRETRDYVPSVLRNNYWYHRLYSDFSKSETVSAPLVSEPKPSSATGQIYSELLLREIKKIHPDFNP